MNTTRFLNILFTPAKSVPEYYNAPILLKRFHSFLKAIRFFNTVDFVDVIIADPDPDGGIGTLRRKDYIYGLIFLASCMGVVYLIWMGILALLKCRGKAVGCASGRAFETKQYQRTSLVGSSSSTASTAEHGHHDDDVSPYHDNEDENPYIENESYVSFNDVREDDESSRMEQRRRKNASRQRAPCYEDDEEQRSIAETSFQDELYVDPEIILQNKRRARRTRTAFMFVWIMLLAGVILFMLFTFARLKQSIEHMGDLFATFQEVLNQVAESLKSIKSSADAATSIVNSTNYDFRQFCPNGTNTELVQGVDLEGLADLALEEFDRVESSISTRLESYNDTFLTVQKWKDDIEDGMLFTEEYLWIAPGVLLGISAVSTIGAFAVVLAWKGDSGRFLQSIMSYFVLPILVLLSVVSWIALTGSAVTTAVTGDMCLNRGTPDATIAEVIRRLQLDYNSTEVKLVSAYTNNCTIEDPLAELNNLEESLVLPIAEIWRYIATVDSIGREELVDICDGQVDSLLDGAEDLARSLSAIKKSIASTSKILSCNNVNPIYAEAIYDEVCGNVADSISWGAMSLLVITVAVLIMISLRSAWLHQTEEINVYRDDEIADNMILDEHEEYLEFISKFQHEWEEYQGIQSVAIENRSRGEESSRRSETSRSARNDPTGQSAWSGSRSGRYDTDAASSYSYSTPYSTSTESDIPDDISFPSLAVSNTSQSMSSMDDGDPFKALPPSLLPQKYDDEEYEDDRNPWEAEPVSSHGYGGSSSSLLPVPLPAPLHSVGRNNSSASAKGRAKTPTLPPKLDAPSIFADNSTSGEGVEVALHSPTRKRRSFFCGYSSSSDGSVSSIMKALGVTRKKGSRDTALKDDDSKEESSPSMDRKPSPSAPIQPAESYDRSSLPMYSVNPSPVARLPQDEGDDVESGDHEESGNENHYLAQSLKRPTQASDFLRDDESYDSLKLYEL